MKNNNFKRRIPQKPSQRAPLQPTSIDRRIKRRKNQPNRLFPIMVGIGGLCVFLFVFCSIIGNNKGSKDVQETETLQIGEKLTRPDKKETEDASLNLYYYHSMITGDERELYDLILDGMLGHDTSIILPTGIENKLPEMMQMVLNDHPEIFWADGAYQYTAYDDKTDLEINYLYRDDEIKSRTNEIEATVNEFSLLLTPEDTDYDIVRKAYLYLIDTVEYVSDSSDNQNIYSSLVNRESVCAGYSKATQYLLQRNGIQALYVSGLANGSYGWDNHAWNIVRCDGEYYQVDTTFGDGYTNPDVRMAELGIYNYAYLCIDDDTMYRNHQPSQELTIPRCDSLELNYYLQNGLYADTFDEQVMQSMRDSVFNGEKTWCYQFSNYEAYSACLKSIQESAYSTIVGEYLVDACQTTYIHDDKMYYVLCWY